MTTRNRVLTATAALTAAAIATAATATAATAATTATAAPPPVSERVDGVWRTDGYGELLAVDHGRLRVFQTSAVGCLPSQEGTAAGRPGADGTVRFDIPDDDAVTLRPVTRSMAVEQLESSTSRRVLTRQPALPSVCTRPAKHDPRTTFDAVTSTFAENYPFFAPHHVDWDALRAKYRARIDAHTTPQQLFDVLSAMLAPLADAHVALVGPDGQVFARQRPGTLIPTPQLDAQLKKVVTGTDLLGLGVPAAALHEYANGRIAAATLPGGIGYLRVSGFTGYTDADTETANRQALDDALDRVLTADAVTHWRGLMIDLRINGGGSDALALELTRHLIDRPQIAYAKRYWRGSSWSVPQPVVVRPAVGAYAGPLTVLTSGSTVSAGETFLQSLLSRPRRPVVVGEPTQGVFSDTLDRRLPNGWTVSLPNEQYLTASGTAFDGRGIPPTITRPLSTGGDTDPLFDTAYRTLAGH